MSELRRELAVLGLAVPVIQTLHECGYRLSAEFWPQVRCEEVPPPLPPVISGAATSAAACRFRRWFPLGAAVGLLLMGARYGNRTVDKSPN